MLDLQGFLALLPVARTKFVCLQRIENAQNFLRIAAYRKIGYVCETNDAVRIDDERRSLGYPFFFIQNSKLPSKIALDVCQHRKRKVLQVSMMCPPRMMNEFVVRRTTQNLCVAIQKLLVQLSKSRNLGGANKREILRPKEVH